MPDGRQPDGAIEKFIGKLWDSGLEPGHSVRTIAESVEEAVKDVTVDTSLLESRLVAGSAALLAEMEARLRERRNVRDFFDAKFREQKRRHERFQEAAYNLEPNIKESPGGLRDLQMVLWLARAAGLGTSWRELADQGLITPHEAAAIAINERVLQDLRIRLHYLAGRREDRLVFDHQIEIARQLKLEGPAGMAPSDLLMRRYYLAAKAIWRFNQILLANLFDRITPESERKPQALDPDFEVVSRNLEIRDEKLFEKKPGMILEAFRRLQSHPQIVGLGPRTLRALSRALPHINKRFPRSAREPPPLHGDHARRAPHVDAAPHEPLRRPGPLPAGVRPHRGADAARPLPRVHRGRAHPHGDPQPAPLPHPALRPRVPVPVAAHAGVRPPRGALPCGALPRRGEGPRRGSLDSGRQGTRRASRRTTDCRRPMASSSHGWSSTIS
jgi:hypothetical protein